MRMGVRRVIALHALGTAPAMQSALCRTLSLYHSRHLPHPHLPLERALITNATVRRVTEGRRALSVCAHIYVMRRSIKGAVDVVMTVTANAYQVGKVLVARSSLAKVGVERRRTHHGVSASRYYRQRMLSSGPRGQRRSPPISLLPSNRRMVSITRDDRPTPLLSGTRMAYHSRVMCCRKSRESAYARRAGLALSATNHSARLPPKCSISSGYHRSVYPPPQRISFSCSRSGACRTTPRRASS